MDAFSHHVGASMLRAPLCLGLYVAIAWGVAPLATFGQLPFTEEAALRGLQFTSQNLTVYGYGIAINDLDGDGDLDVVATGAGLLGATGVFENSGAGFFIDRTLGNGIPTSPYHCGVSVADYDGDGDLDLYLSAFLSPNKLLRNDGGFVFTDVTVALGVGGGSLRTQGTCWGDYDGDGWLDLYVCNRFAANQLFRNNAGLGFTDVAPILGVADIGLAYQASFFDYDLDDDVDLYLANEARMTPEVNRHWRNDGGVFVEVGASNGSNIDIDSMGLSVGDFNHDGGYDLYVTNDTPGNVLLQAAGLQYTNVSSPAGIQVNALCWGTLFVDFDNDQWLDLFVAASHQSNRMLRNPGSLPFVDVTTQCAIGSAGYNPVATTATYCCAAGDLDNDGDLDLLVQSSGEPMALYMNHEGGQRNWLKVRLKALVPNAHGVGSHVRVTTGATIQQQPLLAGVGLKSSNPMELHFGLAAATVVNRVQVRWPDGAVTQLSGVPVNQTLIIDRATLGTFDDCNRNFVDDAIEISVGNLADADSNGVPDRCEASFVRGDVDSNGQRTVVDAVVTLGHVFGASNAGCLDAADCNDDGVLDLLDPIHLLHYLLLQGNVPPAPNTACDVDPTVDGSVDLGCEVPLCWLRPSVRCWPLQTAGVVGAQRPVTAERVIDRGENRLPILRQAAADREVVRRVVGAEDRVGRGCARDKGA